MNIFVLWRNNVSGLLFTIEEVMDRVIQYWEFKLLGVHTTVLAFIILNWDTGCFKKFYTNISAIKELFLNDCSYISLIWLLAHFVRDFLENLCHQIAYFQFWVLTHQSQIFFVYQFMFKFIFFQNIALSTNFVYNF